MSGCRWKNGAENGGDGHSSALECIRTETFPESMAEEMQRAHNLEMEIGETGSLEMVEAMGEKQKAHFSSKFRWESRASG